MFGCFFLFKLSSSTLENSYLLDTSHSYDSNPLTKEIEKNNYTALLAVTKELFTEKGRLLLDTVNRKKHDMAHVGICGQGPETSDQIFLMIK